MALRVMFCATLLIVYNCFGDWHKKKVAQFLCYFQRVKKLAQKNWHKKSSTKKTGTKKMLFFERKKVAQKKRHKNRGTKNCVRAEDAGKKTGTKNILSVLCSKPNT
tara:strand:+ start:342 stop:659 length:318 start_codon:yes stop_codon:yes gene_type:complete